MSKYLTRFPKVFGLRTKIFFGLISSNSHFFITIQKISTRVIPELEKNLNFFKGRLQETVKDEHQNLFELELTHL